jgi:putative phosphoribosyl transferase
MPENSVMRRRMMFADRDEAGRLLADRLAEMTLPNALVVALPRGGVPVGAQIARRLNTPLDVAFVRKLGAPDEPELAIGAVADGDPPEIVLNARLVEELGLSEDFIRSAVARELAAIEQRRLDYANVRPAAEPSGRTVIVVDDGVATGMTMQAALRSIRRRGAVRVVAAVPVASREAAAMLREEADDVVCLSAPRRFGSVGSFYRSFVQVSDADVTALLETALARTTSR